MTTVKVIFPLLVLTLLISISGCVEETISTADDQSNQQETNGNGTAQNPFLFHSEITGIDYPISYYFPDEYSRTSKDPFDVMYVLDGQYHFANYSRIVEESDLPIVVIGIEQGPSGRRLIDYILPGSLKYFEFLNSEFVPFIEETYNVKTENRTLTGESASGIFVNTALLIDDFENPLFSNLLSNDAPFLSAHNAESRELEENRFAASKNMPVKFVMTGATLDADIDPFDSEVEEYYKLLLSREYEGLEITRLTFQVNHFNIGTPSLEAALDVFYKGD